MTETIIGWATLILACLIVLIAVITVVAVCVTALVGVTRIWYPGERRRPSRWWPGKGR